MEKETQKGGSLKNRGKGRGLWAKVPSFLLPPEQNRGGRSGAPAVADSGVLGHGGGRGVGGNGEEEGGFDSPA